MMPNNKKIPLTIRIPEEIHKELSEIAITKTRSINEQVLHFVKLALKDISDNKFSPKDIDITQEKK